jgi:large subunit ribosomal protein L18
MLNKKNRRIKRSKKTRVCISMQNVLRLSVFRSNLHIYANIISNDGSKILISASTLEKEMRHQFNGAVKTGNVAGASLIGKQIAERAKKMGILNVAFDRSGFAYHGRVKALADAAREAGLRF